MFEWYLIIALLFFIFGMMTGVILARPCRTW